MPKQLAVMKSPSRLKLTAEELLEDILAKEAVERLVQRGVRQDDLLRLVIKIPQASNEVKPLVTGIENRTLRRVPDHISALAATIKKINEGSWLSPDHLPHLAQVMKKPELLPDPLNLTITPQWAELTAKRMGELPTLLLFYASHLRASLNLFYPIGRRQTVSKSRRGFRMQTYLTLKLLTTVRVSALRPCYQEIATLLEVAYRAAGRPKTVDVDQLKKLEKNNFWLISAMRETSHA
jgi:hypothetical protein